MADEPVLQMPFVNEPGISPSDAEETEPDRSDGTNEQLADMDAAEEAGQQLRQDSEQQPEQDDEPQAQEQQQAPTEDVGPVLKGLELSGGKVSDIPVADLVTAYEESPRQKKIIDNYEQHRQTVEQEHAEKLQGYEQLYRELYTELTAVKQMIGAAEAPDLSKVDFEDPEQVKRLTEQQAQSKKFEEARKLVHGQMQKLNYAANLDRESGTTSKMRELNLQMPRLFPEIVESNESMQKVIDWFSENGLTAQDIQSISTPKVWGLLRQGYLYHQALKGAGKTKTAKGKSKVSLGRGGASAKSAARGSRQAQHSSPNADAFAQMRHATSNGEYSSIDRRAIARIEKAFRADEL